MHISTVFLSTCVITTVYADLTCLEWGLISPIVGLFCYFEPQTYKAVENRTVAAVEEAIQDTEALVKFDLTHNPAVVAYNFLDQTNQGGVGQGGQYLKNVTNDFEDVVIGFGKETTNQIITLMEFSYWNDLSTCLITGAASLAIHAQKRMKKRIGLHGTTSRAKAYTMNAGNMISDTDALSMAHECLSKKFQQLANPLKFHINGE